MHTTDLPVEPIGGLYEGDRLAPALRDARARTLGLYGHLDLASARFPCIAIVNPPLWELAHIAWFQERWCLRHDASQGRIVRGSLLPGADALLDSARVAHDSRWTLPYPPAAVLLGYMSATLEATLHALERAGPEARYFFELSLLHEDMHGEALLMTLQTLGLPPPRVSMPLRPPRAASAGGRDVHLEGGAFEMGSRRGDGRFVFDNEKWAHPVRVAPFAIGACPVTQGEYRRFVEDRGYERRELWTPEGWAWRERANLRAPAHWRREDASWTSRRFDRFEPLDDAGLMVHACLHEAAAYCRWAGRRLPTEMEWEYAATRSTGLEHAFHGVWEWTSTPFAPYPGFSADPYEEYSQPWFDSHYVLRGGSFATRSRLAHARFRNFYLPHRNDVFAGFRTCAAEA